MRPFCLAVLAALLLPQAAQAAECPAPRPMHFVVESRITRDVQGFTEGLEVHDHDLFESTGALFGGSRLLRMALAGPDKGHVTELKGYGTRFFGEGLTILKDRIYQLTWQDHDVYVYDLSGKRLRTMSNAHEGWGLTNDGSRLIFDDGGASLYFVDPAHFAIRHSVEVRRGSQPVEQLNELEYVNGKIFANVFLTRDILRIDPVSGCVEAQASLDNLWLDHMSAEDRALIARDSNFVLNGIAHDPATGLFYVTGKVWPMVFSGHFIED